MVIRMEIAMNGMTADNMKHLTPCSDCMLSFCCSPAHWEAACRLHQGPSEDLRDGLSQCEMNNSFGSQSAFKSGWVSLKGVSWTGEFSDEIRKSFGIPAPLPITFLVTAASRYPIHDHDNFILGADTRELSCAGVFEEILHRTPEVKTLKLVMCSPDVPRRNSLDHKICPACMVLGRSYVIECAAESVLATLLLLGQQVREPDLCNGFNSGAGQHANYTWPTTFKLLVERKLPSVFTAYNREATEDDAAMLGAAGCKVASRTSTCPKSWEA
ncbi:hypothetical protein B0H14DRAFT_3521860 [Mycena olivaceomarginata]|nr:hypothetical protein B0H14DRAFT_3521860 [Mycena olivaceomarginata]